MVDLDSLTEDEIMKMKVGELSSNDTIESATTLDVQLLYIPSGGGAS